MSLSVDLTSLVCDAQLISAHFEIFDLILSILCIDLNRLTSFKFTFS